jgi:predicted  nucleic acid-binding Zn-ribbon protein
MTIRKEVLRSHELNDRINELQTQKMFLHANLDELNELQEKLRNGDQSVAGRIRELFDLIEEKREWIARNVPIIKKQMAS